MGKAVKILHEKYPTLIVDGEVQANFALNSDLMNEKFSFSHLANKQVNTLIFPIGQRKNFSSLSMSGLKILHQLFQSISKLLGLK